MWKQTASSKGQGAKEVRAYLSLARPTNAFMVFFASLLAGFLAGSPPLCLFPAAFGAALVSAGAQAINDYYDYYLDRRKGKRQILSRREVFLTAILFYSVGVLASALASHLLALLAVFAVALSWLYSAQMRGVKYLGNVVVAFLSAFVFVFAGICGDVERIFFLFILSFFASWAREIIKDIEDLHADIGQKITLPMVVGEKRAAFFSIFLIFLAVFLSAFSSPIHPIFLIPAYTVFIFSVTYLLRGRFREAQRLCKMGMFLALLAFVVGALP